MSDATVTCEICRSRFELTDGTDARIPSHDCCNHETLADYHKKCVRDVMLPYIENAEWLGSRMSPGSIGEAYLEAARRMRETLKETKP